ncbi:MAG: PHP domain-containing protein [Gammaproteobacteria bacterium]
MESYAELHAISNFTFLRGASHPEELVERAIELGYSALALTDECSVAGVVRAHGVARGQDLKFIVGAEFRLIDGPRLVVLATDRRGYARLCRLITRGRRRAEKGSYRLCRADLDDGLPDCLVLWLPERRLDDRGEGDWFASHFPDRCWIAVELAADGFDRVRLEALERLGGQTDLPLVAAGDVHMHRRGRRALQDTLTAIRLKVPVRDAGFSLHPNGERHLRSRPRLAELYPAPLLRETINVAERIDFSLDELAYEYPHELVPEGHTPASWLAHLTDEGMARRWPGGAPGKVCDLVRHELALIADLSYESYFLTVHDIVSWARARGILCQGRGSAANSAVCFCLGITEVDPDRMATLVERFISRERNEPPDIDVDFEHERREEVIQYIYGKYGRDHAALAATVITYRPRSAMRDVGKALGLSSLQTDRLARAMQWWDGSHVDDEDDLEELGLLKVDVLGLGMLTAIRRCFELLRDFDGRELDLASVPAEDPAVYDMISAADTMGVFQIESRAQMAMLPRLRPRCYYDLVIEVAIIRPGPIQGDMVHPYLRRRRGEEAVSYPSEEVRAVLERTLGVPIFQEQVMELAVVAAGFSPGEADRLRRAMAAWKRRGGLGPFEDRLKNGMRERGYSEYFAEQIFNQIQGFGEYGFPESHSASFALLVYVSAWLKCHEPAAFLCALLNSQPMGFYAPSQLVQDAVRHGVEVRPVDVNASRRESTLERESEGRSVVRLGLGMVKGLADTAAEAVVAARENRGSFRSVQELAECADLDRAALSALAAAGALATLAGHRFRARWDVAGVEVASGLFSSMTRYEPLPMLGRPAEGQDIRADYQSIGLTLGRHPMALLRERFRRRHYIAAEDLPAAGHGARVRVAGLVITRQRPGSASGVTFVTLEDETGQINLVVWKATAEAQRRQLLSARLMGVEGEVQIEGEVIHVIAQRLTEHNALLGTLALHSRDFH